MYSETEICDLFAERESWKIACNILFIYNKVIV